MVSVPKISSPLAHHRAMNLRASTQLGRQQAGHTAFLHTDHGVHLTDNASHNLNFLNKAKESFFKLAKAGSSFATKAAEQLTKASGPQTARAAA